MDDIPAPILRAETPRPAPRQSEPIRVPVLLEDDFSEIVADTRVIAGPGRAARPSVLGAVLFGGLVAVGLVALAYLLRR